MSFKKLAENIKNIVISFIDEYYFVKYCQTKNHKYLEKYYNLEGKYFGTNDPISDEECSHYLNLYGPNSISYCRHKLTALTRAERWNQI